MRSVATLTAFAAILAGCCNLSSNTRSTPRAAVRATQLFEHPSGASFLPRGTPQEVGVDRAALERLVRVAEQGDSDALLVVKDGRVIVERDFGKPARPTELMSITKSVVGLAVAFLISDGKIDALDVRASRWFPEWTDDPRSAITLRHLVTHTSGISHAPDAALLASQPDRVAYVRGLPLATDPGSTFSYNNEAVQLISSIVETSSGSALDQFIAQRLFRPLGITSWKWARDHAGNVQTFSGLELSARDLARIGQWLLTAGSEGSGMKPDLAGSLGRPDSGCRCGWLWWAREVPPRYVQTEARLEALRGAGFAASKLAPLTNRPFSFFGTYWMEAGVLLDGDQRAQLAGLHWRGTSPIETLPAAQLGLYADGWGGQKLAVYPSANLIIVRLRRIPPGESDAVTRANSTPELLDLAEQLTGIPAMASGVPPG